MSADAAAEGDRTTTPFHDLTEFAAIPRVTALRLSPDGDWLAAAVQTLSADGKKYLTSLWRVDPGGGPARRLTRSAEGEANPRFLPDGSLLFTSRRPDPGASQDGVSADTAALWLLPPGGGEARVIAALPGGVTAAEAARGAGTIVLSSPVLPAAGREGGRGGLVPPGSGGSGGSSPRASTDNTAADDARLRKERGDAGVTAILHESAPVRFWDHDLGPDQVRLFSVDPDRLRDPAGNAARPTGEFPGLRDLTPDPGRALDDEAFELTPDGTSVITGWQLWHPAGQSHAELVMIDVATGKRQVLLSAPEYNFSGPRVSPDGRFIVCERETQTTPERPPDLTLVLLGVNGAGAAGETGRDLLPGLDRWPAEPAWSHDSRTVYFAADDGGRRPVFRLDVATGQVTRVTGDDGAYTDLNPAPDGRYLYALRSAVDSPPAPVRIDLDPKDPGTLKDSGQGAARPAALDSPGVPLAVPGRLAEVEAAADDGQPVRAWLVLPESASAAHPAPLLLWVHGGPMSSWNAWSWRWNPWLMAARGYAVLLPDPALSTGYGQEFIARGYHDWGARPFADIMAVTEPVLARPDIDADRAGMMGGSYGGYMANWMAGHTDRFKAIVSHAGLWALDQMFGTTDHPMFWRPQFGDPLTQPGMYEANSPNRHIEQIRTPMLVIHGNKDYRVPVSEALRLWWDLSRYGAEAKFLYFPDENHWILTPGHARIWYETVFAFLAEHLLGQEWQRPALL
ncbi:MAG TPA: S9 family peptidase [Streptosporangiaceae bacterium]|nr:S9 family peptidase [Streptosporangiaceae bacterium]